MLRHVIAQSILLLTVLAAGVPLACAQGAPTQECCGNGPNAPCAPPQAETAQANRLDFCCVAGSAIATTTAVATSSDERGKHWDRAAPPTLLFVLNTLATAYVQSPSVDDFRIVSQPLSDSTLYLSTGRLRL
jgi:hypothetical protein